MKAKTFVNSLNTNVNKEIVIELDALASEGEIEKDYDWESNKTHYRFDDGSQVIFKGNEIESIS